MKIMLLTNILTPFRIYFYDQLYHKMKDRNIEFKVYTMNATAPGRTWKYDDFQREYTELLKGKLYEISGIHVIINPHIEREIKRFNPDIVICAGSYMLFSVWSALKLKNKLGYKIYLWSESHLKEKRDYGKLKLKFREYMRIKVIGKFDGFWYAGQMAKEFLDLYGNKKAHYVFVPNLVNECVYESAQSITDEDKIKIMKEYDISRDKIVLLCPARLSKEKGIPEFLNLFKDSTYKNKCIILIPGIGELEDKIRKIANEYKIDVRLLGFKEQNEIIKLYSVSDIFLLPSLADSNPLTCIEAAWAGKPMIVSKNVGNYPELIEEGKNGCVIDYDNKEDSLIMIDKFLSLGKDKLKLAGGISYDIAKNKYNTKLVIDRIINQTIEII